eukprot:TRINITY_DN7962_c0_g1_i1.p1 TRINITY_DN7962_c0_g1~~TRINITY_DN7962_c0_g1_i1.p1  ORF type:complete len:108 (+),score=13.66 TRINITY_DN7962_c0_g1_i1:45-368(+)
MNLICGSQRSQRTTYASLHAGNVRGHYVIRRSTSHPDAFVLVVSDGQSIKHYPVDHCEGALAGKVTVLCPGNREVFRDLNHVIEHYTRQRDGICSRLTMNLNEGNYA